MEPARDERGDANCCTPNVAPFRLPQWSPLAMSGATLCATTSAPDPESAAMEPARDERGDVVVRAGRGVEECAAMEPARDERGDWAILPGMPSVIGGRNGARSR